ncbi:DUF1461 domain-containing protein [Candidatus Woesearchaeota archaeon]|nr:DUF1461 domain-containing protein [Candidatus Woesearchaeota archaeon]
MDISKTLIDRQRIATITLTVSLTLLLAFFLVLASVKATIFFSSYLPEQQEVVDYLLQKGELSGAYTDAERAHLDDVQKLFQKGNALFLMILGIGLIFISLNHARFRESTLFWTVVLSNGIAIVLLSLFALGAVRFFFTEAFTQFHEFFFPQGNWQFPADSLLIQTFPLEFFLRMSIKIGLGILAGGILFILIPLYLRHGHQSRNT